MGGGQTGQSAHCGNWAKQCGGGNMGGSGLVRVTFHKEKKIIMATYASYKKVQLQKAL